MTYVRLDGSTKPEERPHLIARFQRDDATCRVAILRLIRLIFRFLTMV